MPIGSFQSDWELEKQAEEEGMSLVKKFSREKQHEAVMRVEVPREDPEVVKKNVLERICDVLLKNGPIDASRLKVGDVTAVCAREFRSLLRLHLIAQGKRKNDKADVRYVLEQVQDAAQQRILEMTRLSGSEREEDLGDALLSGVEIERIRDVAEDLYEDISRPERYRARKKVLVGKLAADLPIPADDVWRRVKVEMARIRKEKEREEGEVWREM